MKNEDNKFQAVLACLFIFILYFTQIVARKMEQKGNFILISQKKSAGQTNRREELIKLTQSQILGRAIEILNS